MQEEDIFEGFNIVEEVESVVDSVDAKQQVDATLEADILEGFEIIEEKKQPEIDIEPLKEKKAKEFDRGIFKMAERKAYDKYKLTGEIDLELIPEEDKRPGFIEDKISRLARGTIETVKGFEQFKTSLQLTGFDIALDVFNPEITKEQKIESLKAVKGILDTKSGIEVFDIATNKLGEHVREYDSESITEDVKAGNFAQAADRAIGGVFESAPSLALAYTGIGGLIALGTSAAGNKFDEEFEKNPEEGTKTIFLNSILTGTTEAAFEGVTRGILKRARLLSASGNTKAANDLISNYSTSVIRRFATDPAKEGLSEFATELTTDLIDIATFEKDEWNGLSSFVDENFNKWADAGIIGTVTGAGVVTTGALTSDQQSVRNAAEYTLTPESDKKIISDAAIEINSLNEQIKQVNNQEDIDVLEAEIVKEEEKIINTRKKVSEELNMMNPDELKAYAGNIDQINKEKKRAQSNSIFVREANVQNLANLELENEALIRESVDRRLNENIKTVGVKDLGRTVNDYDSPKDYQKAYDNTEFGKKNSMNVTSSDGFIDTEGDIYINKEVAQKVRNVNVPAHELLHGILDNNIKEPGQLKRLVTEFKAILPKEVADLIQKRIDDNYRFTTDEQGNRVEKPESEYMQEYFTAFADLIGNRKVKFNENIFAKVGEKITPIFKGKGYGHIKFETGKDVYDFIKSYQKQIAKGELKPETIEAAKKVAEQDIKMSKTASDNVQKIYEDQGVGGALDIIEEFKPIVNKIVQRRSEAPNFDRQLLTDEIETGKRGLLELIQDYDIESGVPLAAYINKFLPARAIEASRRVLGESFTEDISQRVDIAAPEVEVEVKTKEEKVPRSLRKKLNIEKGSDLYNKVKDAVVKTFGTKLPEVTDPKFKKALSDSYKRELKKEVNALMGTRSDFKMFVTNNAETLYKSIPQETINKRFQAFSEPVLDKEGKQVREKTAVGKGIFKKKPFNKEEFINYFLGEDVGASTKGTRKTALSETIADEMALDATMEVIEDPKVFEKFKEIQEIEGKKVPKDIKPKISEKVKRPEGFKFSKNLKALEKQNQKRKQPAKIKIHEAIREVAGQLDHIDPKSVEKIKRFIIDVLAPVMKGDVYNFIRSQDLSPIGNRGEKKIGLEFFLESIVPRSKDQDVIGFNQTLVEENILGTLSDLRKELSEAGIKEGDQVTILSEIFKKQELNDLNDNLKNLDKRKKATKDLLKKFRKSYKNDKSGLPVLKELFYNPNASRMWGKNVALLRSIFEGVTNKAKYEEHTYQFGNWSRRSLQAIKSNDKIFNGWLDWAAENYYQTAFDKTFKTPITRNIKIGPTTKSQTRNLTYQEAVDKTYIKDGVVWEAKAQEHPLLREQLEEAFKTGDFSKVPASEIRFFNEFFTLNPFKLTLDGKTFAEKYNLKVPKNLQDNIDVYQKAGELIYKKILTNAGILTGIEAITNANAQLQLDAEVKLANDKTKSKIANEKELNNNVVKFSKNMFTNEVVGYAKTVDEALSIARDPNAPVKKIRVFDFDDTLAKSKSLVFYNRTNETGKPVPNNKAIFMIGGPGSGKSNIGKGLQLGRDGWKVVNQDIFIESEKAKQGLPEIEKDYTKEQRSKRAKIGAAGRKAAEAKMEKYTKAGNGMVIDGTGASYNATMKKVNKLKEQGYEVFMVHAKTSNEVALERNRARKERSLPDFIVEKTQESVNSNIGQYKSDLGDNFIEIDTETIEYGKPLPKEFVNDAKARFYATERGKLNAEEFAQQGAGLIEEGFAMDFSDFNIVREGEKGPLFDVAKKIQKARGTDDVFVLTARAPESQQAIHEFLKSEGLEIPLENITGLGNSTGEAKANWLVDKAAEGYNDFYFADDAYQNVKAVKDAMSVLDVKSKVQQAKVKFSKSVNKDFNKIIEQTTGIASEKVYSEAKAKVRGANKGNKKFFIPYSAEDFMGLIYPLLSKGKLGDSQMAWFKKNLLDPYAMANENLSTDRLQLMEDFKTLKKALDVPKDLRKKTDSGFTKEQAVRVYLFNKAGFDVPGISKTDLNELLDLVNSDGVLKAFGDQIFNITKGDGYAKPGENWLVGTITTDLIDVLNTVKRAKYLEQSGYTANAELIFSKENLNKLEAAYGSKYREAMENILGRMKSGKNRIFSGNRLSNRVLDYINNSTGAIMFFNTRSAVLQTISAINFLNWSFNNPIKAGAAFANQKQYWKDFVELINSDYLVDRRNGLKLNINESEIADAAATSKNKAKAAINYILQKGFLPTQYADSFAIASGGATFYRNRINDLIKNQGMSEADAKKQAMLEWRQTAEISQQSSDPSKISAQQASDLGRVILAFANTPMQYARIQKRAVQDLANGRGDAKTHVSKIIYYAVVQNLIFNALQSALFKLGFDEEEDEKKEKMYLRTANGMLDSQLRGLGLAGATVAVIKNFLTDIYERSGRKRPEYVDSIYKLLQISPPVSSKISKIRGAAWQFDSKKRREEIFKKGFSIDNPAYEAGAKVISATANIPLDRVYSKVDNISGAMSEDAETWQTIAMLAGWPKWNIMPDAKESSSFNKGNVKIKKSKYKKKSSKSRFSKR